MKIGNERSKYLDWDPSDNFFNSFFTNNYIFILYLSGICSACKTHGPLGIGPKSEQIEEILWAIWRNIVNAVNCENTAWHMHHLQGKHHRCGRRRNCIRKKSWVEIFETWSWESTQAPLLSLTLYKILLEKNALIFFSHFQILVSKTAQKQFGALCYSNPIVWWMGLE